MNGERRCRMHGGKAARKNRGRSNEAAVKHGLRSSYIPTELLPAVLRYKKQLATTAGTKELLQAGAALTAARRDQVAGANLDSFLAVGEAFRRDVLATIKVEEHEHRTGADKPTTINVSIPCFDQVTPSSAKRANGDKALLIEVQGSGPGSGPLMLDEDTKTWRPARSATVAGSELWEFAE